MKTHNRIVGVIGLVVATAVVLATSGCDPYQQPNKAQPQVIGVVMVDVNGNGAPPDSASPGCIPPYPQVNMTWATGAGFAGICDPTAVYSACPVVCFPPRTGPGFAPLFTGNLGATYQTEAGGTYTYEATSAYTLRDVPPSIITADAQWDYWMIKVIFNKMLDGASVEPKPFTGIAASNLQIFEGTTNVTRQFAVHYNPSNETSYWGAAIEATLDGGLNPNSTYRIVGTVNDQDGNTARVDVTVSTGTVVDTSSAP